MKIEFESISIKEGQIDAVVKLKGIFNEINGDHSIDREISYKIIEQLTRKAVDQLWLERGPAIMESVTSNQIVNAILMKFAARERG